MRESYLERHLVTSVKAKGGLCWKFVSPGMVGVPDRIVIAPSGTLVFVEMKAPGKVPTAMQERRHADLRTRGQRVLVLDSIEAVDAFVGAL